ncbi:hypothetical protein [Paenibacillus tyrfis]|uniref:hypothetical protein n=1 Tax=Paenibacillus tyrfis TaxID=1501230 RepID=UPI000B5965AA|nr:hypothetical protein [Paenibacillus tyrfis]
MKDGFEQLIIKLTSLYREDKSVQEQLKHIEMKSAFRSPEMQHESWNELARFVKTMPIDRLALLLVEQSEAISFSEDEKAELRRALFKNRKNISDLLSSSKTNEADKAVATRWLEDNTRALVKLQSNDSY